MPLLVWSQAGQLRVVFGFSVVKDRIVSIEMLADPDQLAALDVQLMRPEAPPSRALAGRG